MTDLKTDAEKAEELKAWWKNNGTSIIVGIGLAVGTLFAYDYFQKHQGKQQLEAAKLYGEVKEAKSPTPSQIEATVSSLQKDFHRTTAATLATLKYAKLLVEAGNLEKAVEQLQWAQANHRDESYTPLINLRLARAHMAQEQNQEALALLDQSYPKSFEGLKEEVRGDIYRQQSKWVEAKSAYENALKADNSNKKLVQIKLDNLPGE